MFSGRLGRFSATAANPSLIAVSCPSSSRYHRTRSRNLTRLPTPLAVSLHRVVGGAGLLHPRVSLLAAVWVCIALGATGRDRGGGRTTPCRRARHAGLRNAPPPDSRHLARHGCACVRPTLSPGAVEVLTEGSNYTGRRITNVGRKPSVDRTLLLGRAELVRARHERDRDDHSCPNRMPPGEAHLTRGAAQRETITDIETLVESLGRGGAVAGIPALEVRDVACCAVGRRFATICSGRKSVHGVAPTNYTPSMMVASASSSMMPWFSRSRPRCLRSRLSVDVCAVILEMRKMHRKRCDDSQ